LLEALEYSAADYEKVNFLQLSGVHVVYNVSQPVGERVKSVDVLCRQCDVPVYEPLSVEKMYRMIVPSWIASGGNGFTMFGEHRQNPK
jgi:2',3'-cyclic-nucleotide 2'-phosphodiesterase (5'-nucleotidase family)